MDGADRDAWSAVATEWAELWGDFGDPVRRVLIQLTGIGSGTRVLDVGCGSGEFLRMLGEVDAVPSGVDPAPAMIALARARVPRADIRAGTAESLPWSSGSFDVVTAINALQFADDIRAGLAELTRVTVPGGYVAVANWAEAERNDVNVIEAAVAASFDEELPPDGELRMPGGLSALFQEAGLSRVVSGVVEVPWEAPDENRFVRGILLGEDPEGLAAGAGTVLEAGRRFRTTAGGYRLTNAFRYAVGRTPTARS